MAEEHLNDNTRLPQSVLTNNGKYWCLAIPFRWPILYISYYIHNSTMVITWFSERTGPSLQPRSDAPTTPLFDDSGNLHYFLIFYKLFELLYLFLPVILLTHVSLAVIDDDEGDIFEEDEGYLFAGQGICAKYRIYNKFSTALSKLLSRLKCHFRWGRWWWYPRQWPW
jgi:hypothetical protein